MPGLEDRLGVRLLNRTTRSVSRTEAGIELLGCLQAALASLDDALGAVASFRGQVAGTVVRDVLPRMAERFPDVTVDIVVEGRLIDIVSGGFDAGVRLIGSIPRT
jgi:DNA-binding transcriptional LysR family regulator